MDVLTIDDFVIALEQAVNDIPPRFLGKLNGGINLHQGSKRRGARYVLGEYIEEKNGACYIVLYYGSFSQVCQQDAQPSWQAKIVSAVRAGIQYHLESQAQRTKLPKVKLGIQHDPSKKVRRIY